MASPGDAIKAALLKSALDSARESASALRHELEGVAAASDRIRPIPASGPAPAADAHRLAEELRGLLDLQRSGAPAGLTIGQQAVMGRSPWVGGKPPAQPPSGGGGGGGKEPGPTTGQKKQAADAGKKPGEAGESAFKAPKDLKYLLKHAGIGKAAMSAMGAAAGLELTKLALGYKGMAQLTAITQRAGLQFRQMFAGINPAPVVRAADRFFQLFNKANLSGQALSGLFGRVFNSLFGAVEQAEPIVSAFVEGMIGGALNIEIAYYKARLALMPLTNAIEDMIGPLDSLGVAAMAGQTAVVALGVAGTIAVAPYLPLAAAILAVVKALEQLAKLQREIESAGGIGAAAKGMARHFIEGTGKEGEDAAAARGRAAFDQAEEARRKAGAPKTGGGAPAGNVPEALVAGAVTGKAYSDGLAKGVAAGQPGVDAAGAAAAKGLDAATRRAGQIQSPSKVAQRTGREFPAGTAKGIRDGQRDVDAAAEEAMVPRPKGGAAATMQSGGAVDMTQVIALLQRIEENTRGLAQARPMSGGMSPGLGRDLRDLGRALAVGVR